MIDASIYKLNSVSTQIQGIMEQLSLTVSNLDTAHENGMAMIETSKKTLLQTVSSTFAEMRTKFASDIARRKETVERIRGDWQVNMREVEKDVVNLKDFFGKYDQKSILNQELVGSLTKQSTHKFERIIKDLRNCKLPPQEFTVSLSSIDNSVKAIKQLTIEANDNIKGELGGRDENIGLNHDVLQVRRKTNLPQSKKSSAQQHTGDMAKKGRSTTMNNPGFLSRAWTLADYTEGRLKIKYLSWQSINDYAIRSMSFSNDRIWLLMWDGTVNVVQINANDALFIERTFRVQQRGNQIINSVMTGPDGKILGRFDDFSNESLYEISENGLIIDVISKEQCDNIVADMHTRTQILPNNDYEVLLNDTIGNVLFRRRSSNSLSVLLTDDTLHDISVYFGTDEPIIGAVLDNKGRLLVLRDMTMNMIMPK